MFVRVSNYPGINKQKKYTVLYCGNKRHSSVSHYFYWFVTHESITESQLKAFFGSKIQKTWPRGAKGAHYGIAETNLSKYFIFWEEN